MLTTVVVALPNDWKRLNIPFDMKQTGQVLFKNVMEVLKVEEPIWFSISVTPKKGKPHWLHAGKTLDEQDLDMKKPFALKVKYYPPASAIVLRSASLVTRNLLYLDTQEHILNGKINCPTIQALQLAAYTMQAVFGDFNPTLHVPGFLDESKDKTRPSLLNRVIPEAVVKRHDNLKSLDWQVKIFNLHQRLKGWTAAKAEAGYLAVSQQLPQYGISFHEMVDSSGSQRNIGVSLRGLHFYDKSIEGPPEVSFAWGELDSTYVQGHKFAIQLKDKTMPIITVKLKSKGEATELLDMCIGYHMRYNRALERQQQIAAARKAHAEAAARSGAPPAYSAEPAPLPPRNSTMGSNSPAPVPGPGPAPALPTAAEESSESESATQQESMLAEETTASTKLESKSKKERVGTVRIKLGASRVSIAAEDENESEEISAGLADAKKQLDKDDDKDIMNTLKRVRANAKAAEQSFLLFAKLMETNPEEALKMDVDSLM